MTGHDRKDLTSLGIVVLAWLTPVGCTGERMPTGPVVLDVPETPAASAAVTGTAATDIPLSCLEAWTGRDARGLTRWPPRLSIGRARLSLRRCTTQRTPKPPNAPPSEPPAAPPVPPARLTFLWGYVVDGPGVCIEDATVRVVAGQALGTSMLQETPCNAWAYGSGFMFENLIPGHPMTLRASAPGYADEEVTVVPSSGPQQAILITPSRK